jgi:hypothetical protein
MTDDSIAHSGKQASHKRRVGQANERVTATHERRVQPHFRHSPGNVPGQSERL